MPNEPWFKFWAADYLTDANVAKVPPEGRELLIRMWCVCNTRGSAPVDLEDLCLATGLRMSYVSEWLPFLLSKNPSKNPSQKPSQWLSKPFFELRDEMYFSPRMEREKQKSDRARENAQSKANKDSSARTPAKTPANGSAKRPAQKAREPEYKPPTPFLNHSEVPPDGLSPLEYARWFWEQLGMPCTQIELTGSALENYARLEKIPMFAAVLAILGKARADQDLGKVINRFWFENGGHLRKAGEVERKPEPEAPSEILRKKQEAQMRIKMAEDEEDAREENAQRKAAAIQ